MTPPGLQFEHDHQRGRIVITLSAAATVDHWRKAVSTLLAEKAWSEPMVYDMSAVESTSLLLNLPNVVPIVADLLKTHGERGAIAMIVRDGDLATWRQRLAGLFRDLVVIDAFSDLASAHAWLDQMPPRAGS